MSDKLWVIDATMGVRAGMFCCCPVELDARGHIETVITGMNFLGDPPGRVIAVVHADGNDACEEFCEKNDAEINAFLAENRKRFPVPDLHTKAAE